VKERRRERKTHSDNKKCDTQHNDTKYNDTPPHNDTQHNNTKNMTLSITKVSITKLGITTSSVRLNVIYAERLAFDIVMLSSVMPSVVTRTVVAPSPLRTSCVGRWASLRHRCVRMGVVASPFSDAVKKTLPRPLSHRTTVLVVLHSSLHLNLFFLSAANVVKLFTAVSYDFS